MHVMTATKYSKKVGRIHGSTKQFHSRNWMQLLPPSQKLKWLDKAQNREITEELDNKLVYLNPNDIYSLVANT